MPYRLALRWNWSKVCILLKRFRLFPFSPQTSVLKMPFPPAQETHDPHSCARAQWWLCTGPLGSCARPTVPGQGTASFPALPKQLPLQGTAVVQGCFPSGYSKIQSLIQAGWPLSVQNSSPGLASLTQPFPTCMPMLSSNLCSLAWRLVRDYTLNLKQIQELSLNFWGSK